ncbi:HIT family protein [Streptomyces sp. NPDC058872]|uniref:HIT family protein n=1 Tax=Streptomyces sp. NPDC058872 TaxID=3346661 RepID=UPI00369462CE
MSGLVPIENVAETDRALAFHHTNPAHPVHIVVIPKEHVPSLTDLGNADASLLTEVVGLVREVAAGVETAYGSCSVTTNLGLYQESKHMHWHVVFRGESTEQILGAYGHHDG